MSLSGPTMPEETPRDTILRVANAIPKLRLLNADRTTYDVADKQLAEMERLLRQAAARLGGTP